MHGVPRAPTNVRGFSRSRLRRSCRPVVGCVTIRTCRGLRTAASDAMRSRWAHVLANFILMAACIRMHDLMDHHLSPCKEAASHATTLLCGPLVTMASIIHPCYDGVNNPAHVHACRAAMRPMAGGRCQAAAAKARTVITTVAICKLAACIRHGRLGPIQGYRRVPQALVACV